MLSGPKIVPLIKVLLWLGNSQISSVFVCFEGVGWFQYNYRSQEFCMLTSVCLAAIILLIPIENVCELIACNKTRVLKRKQIHFKGF